MMKTKAEDTDDDYDWPQSDNSFKVTSTNRTDNSFNTTSTKRKDYYNNSFNHQINSKRMIERTNLKENDQEEITQNEKHNEVETKNSSLPNNENLIEDNKNKRNEKQTAINFTGGQSSRNIEIPETKIVDNSGNIDKQIKEENSSKMKDNQISGVTETKILRNEENTESKISENTVQTDKIHLETDIDLSEIYYGRDISPHLKPDKKDDIVSRLLLPKADKKRRISQFELALNSRVNEQDQLRRQSFTRRLSMHTSNYNSTSPSKISKLEGIEENSSTSLLPWQKGFSVSPNHSIASSYDEPYKTKQTINSKKEEVLETTQHIVSEAIEKRIEKNKSEIIIFSEKRQTDDMINIDTTPFIEKLQNSEKNEAGNNFDKNNQKALIIIETEHYTDEIEKILLQNEVYNNNDKFITGNNITKNKYSKKKFYRNNEESEEEGEDCNISMTKKHRKRYTKKQSSLESVERNSNTKEKFTDETTQTEFIECQNNQQMHLANMNFLKKYKLKIKEKEKLKYLILFVLSCQKLMRKYNKEKEIGEFINYYINSFNYKKQQTVIQQGILSKNLKQDNQNDRDILKKTLYSIYPDKDRKSISDIIEKHLKLFKVEEDEV